MGVWLPSSRCGGAGAPPSKGAAAMGAGLETKPSSDDEVKREEPLLAVGHSGGGTNNRLGGTADVGKVIHVDTWTR